MIFKIVEDRRTSTAMIGSFDSEEAAGTGIVPVTVPSMKRCASIAKGATIPGTAELAATTVIMEPDVSTCSFPPTRSLVMQQNG